MKTFFMILLGVGLGGAIGALVGLGLGEVAVDLFNISCFEGGCGYAVLFYGLLGLVIGAVLGGIFSYKTLGSPSKKGLWFYSLAGALLGWVVARIVLAGTTWVLVWFLNMNSLSNSAADAVVAVYSVFEYLVILIAILGGGWLTYKWLNSMFRVAD